MVRYTAHLLKSDVIKVFMSKVTAMYIFSGYRDFIKKQMAEDDINFNFGGGGEIDAAVRISDISKLFDKSSVLPRSNFPGLLEYEVLEEFGEVIAEMNKEENYHDNDYYLHVLTDMVMRWITQGEEK